MRLIILAILLYLLYRVVKNYLSRGRDLGREDRAGEISDMVQDPVCKTFVRVGDAEKRFVGGRTYYFCSKECAERFEVEQKSSK